MKLKLPLFCAGLAASVVTLVGINEHKENQRKAEHENQARSVAESYGFDDMQAREDAYTTTVTFKGEPGKAEYSLVAKTITDTDGKRYWLDGPMAPHTPASIQESFNRVRENFCERVESGHVRQTPNAAVICDIK